VGRVSGKLGAEETAVGNLPVRGELDVAGLDLTDQQLDQLFAIDPTAWIGECELTEDYFAQFGERLPAELTAQLGALRDRLDAADSRA